MYREYNTSSVFRGNLRDRVSVDTVWTLETICFGCFERVIGSVVCTRPRARSSRRPRAMAPQQGGVDPAMANFLEEEKRKAMFNEVVSKLADVCFDKCVAKPGASLDRYETACLSQCALRYLETGQVIMGRIQRMQ